MINRKIKITIDILLTIFLILSYSVYIGMTISLHMSVGIIAAILSVAHVWINRKRFLPIFKLSAIKKLNTRARLQYGMSLILTVTWGICIVTGILIGFPTILYSLTGVTDLFMFLITHILTAFLTLIFVIIHIIQHIRPIISYFKKRKI